MKSQYHVYILASKRNGTIYIGSSSQLVQRVTQHKQKLVEGFTKKYNATLLVYFEEFVDLASMVERERQLKTWKREWKIDLIESINPEWKDLYEDLF